MKELGRSTHINIHNTRSLTHTSQACLEHLAVGRSLHGGKYKHIHTHTHTHTSTNLKNPQHHSFKIGAHFRVFHWAIISGMNMGVLRLL